MTDGAAAHRPAEARGDGAGHRIATARLVKRFGGFTAVDEVTVSLGDTGITALIGPNGAGKTTLFNLITGQLAPDEGTVELDGSDVTGRPPEEMARLGVGRSFQDVKLFGGLSTRENIAVYAQPRRTGSIVRTLAQPWHQRALSKAALAVADEVMGYLGITALAGTRTESLGFAQQKLVAIGRLLALQPRILFLDEPASGLDTNGRATLSATIRKLAEDGYSVCFVEHNTHLVRELASRVVFLSQGKILADGPPEAVFSDRSLAETYLGLV